MSVVAGPAGLELHLERRVPEQHVGDEAEDWGDQKADQVAHRAPPDMRRTWD